MKNLFLIISILFLSAHRLSYQEETHTLTLRINDIENSGGSMHIGLYINEETWLDIGSEYIPRVIPVYGEHMEVVYKNLPPGKYAISIFHDEDNNGKINKNFIGYPTEGFAFSKDVKVRFSAPDFEDCAIDLQSDTTIEVHMDY